MRKRVRERSANTTATPKLLLSVEEAAELLSLGRTLVYDLVMRRQIASVKIGRTRRIPLAALHEFVERQAAQSERGGEGV